MIKKKIKSENHIKVLKFLNENNGIYAPDLEAFLQITNSILKTLLYLILIQLNTGKLPLHQKKDNQLIQY